MDDKPLTVWLMRDYGGDLGSPIPDAPSWFAQAACLGSEVDFVEPGGKLAVKAALALCEACPVREPCYELAITEGHHHGIFGGTTERQRQTARQAA